MAPLQESVCEKKPYTYVHSAHKLRHENHPRNQVDSCVSIMPHLLGIEVREYQRVIAKSALKSNTLVVLPTGLGRLSH